MTRPFAPLLALATSPDHRDRHRAGRELASFAEDGDAGVQEALLALLLDHGDTLVTEDTAKALLEHGGDQAWWLFLRAWSQAEPEQLDHLAVAFGDEQWKLALGGDPDSEKVLDARLEPFTLDADPGVRAAARDLLGRFDERTTPAEQQPRAIGNISPTPKWSAERPRDH